MRTLNESIEEHARGRLQGSNQVLRLMTEAPGRKEFLEGVVALVREWTGCRCAGVRVLDGEGCIPYEAYTGFERDLWEKESRLSLARDNCACVRVIAGKPEPQDACCMTPGGSFVVNDSKKFIQNLTERELTRFRGVCIQSGFLSIAVVPIRDNGELLGGIHLADERPGMVPEPRMEFLEGLARLIGEGIKNFNIKDSLNRQNEFLQSIVNRIPVMLYSFDATGKPVLINPEFERLLGWSLEDARLGDIMAGCYPDSDYRREAAGYMAKGTTEWREFTVRTKTGESVETAWSNVRLKDGSLIGIGLDLRERKRTEEALRRSEGLLRRIMDTLPVGLWIADEKGRIVSINPTGQRMWGDAKFVHVERYAEYKGWWPDTGKRVEAHEWALARAFEKGETVLNEEVEIENFKGDHKFILCSAAPVRDESGKITSSLMVAQDITERRIARRALERANRALRVLSQINYSLVQEKEESELLAHACRIITETGGYPLAWVGIADNDRDKRVRCVAKWGPCEGYIDTLEISWADNELGRGPTGRAIRHGKAQTARDLGTDSQFYPWREKAREYGLHSSAAFPLIVDGQVTGALSIYSSEADAFHEHEEEIALLGSLADNLAYGIGAIRIQKEHRRTEQELQIFMKKLQDSNQALQDFATIASHDLQEPLRKIMSFGRMLEDRYAESLGYVGCDYLGRMRNAACRMQALLNSLLNYSRVATEAEPFESVNLSEVIAEVLNDLEVRISETEGKVEVGHLPAIEADPSQMRQLFQNLIGNGLKYHREEKPLVRISGEPVNGGNAVDIRVEDNGIGFEEKQIDRIFKPFQRLHGRSSRFEGTGMGLAICKKIVERHGGSITARSIPGQGSTFIVSLPVKQSNK